MTQTNKKTLHERNFHNDRYDFKALIQSEPSLNEFVKPNKYGDLSIDFANPQAVIALNKALLSFFMGLKTGVFQAIIYVRRFLDVLIIFIILLIYLQVVIMALFQKGKR